MRKVWEAIFTVLAVIIAIEVAIASLKPYLPMLGLVLVVLITGLLVKVLYFRRKFW